ncbi:hypothetical protein ACFWPU_00635 [Streptomyces sp. NPDC058471]|uniref:hypothetical protein n=1 Tax=Streptomyces sp. NPDC058471 TaxID=3346516 RepID=UPI0036497437
MTEPKWEILSAGPMTVIDEDLVLAAYGEDVPCYMDLAGDCKAKVTHLALLRHTDGSLACGMPGKVPFCAEHIKMIKTAFTGFWADLNPPAPCDCGLRFMLADVLPFNAAAT